MSQKRPAKIISAIFIILLAAAGYLYLKNPEAITGILQRKSDETADWKTYRNEKYGFEFKYPGFFGDIPRGDSGVVNLKSDTLSFSVIDEPLNGMEYNNPPGGLSFEYNASEDRWILTRGGVEEAKYGPQRYNVRQGKAYLVAGGDAGGVQQVAYVESPDKKFVVLLTISRGELGDTKPLSDHATIVKILDSIKFNR
ncbi:MAG: hypothetical protein HY454_03475 [Parcubacteria group bacterium]|nr:hypothetical protein [Parcubacteria group bacterium]